MFNVCEALLEECDDSRFKDLKLILQSNSENLIDIGFFHPLVRILFNENHINQLTPGEIATLLDVSIRRVTDTLGYKVSSRKQNRKLLPFYYAYAKHLRDKAVGYSVTAETAEMDKNTLKYCEKVLNIADILFKLGENGANGADTGFGYYDVVEYLADITRFYLMIEQSRMGKERTTFILEPISGDEIDEFIYHDVIITEKSHKGLIGKKTVEKVCSTFLCRDAVHAGFAVLFVLVLFALSQNDNSDLVKNDIRIVRNPNE